MLTSIFPSYFTVKTKTNKTLKRQKSTRPVAWALWSPPTGHGACVAGLVSTRPWFDYELLNGFETGKPHPRAYTVTMALDWKRAGRAQSPSSIGATQGFTRERLSPPGAEAITAVNYTPWEFINLINASTVLAVSMQALETDLHSHSDKERWFYPLKTQCPVNSRQSLSQKLVWGPA